jgi:hypothetical protein
MRLQHAVRSLPLIGVFLLGGCEGKDSEVRRYIRDDLAPYLDSLAYQLCVLKYDQAPNSPGKEICIGPPEGYKPPPPNGAP